MRTFYPIFLTLFILFLVGNSYAQLTVTEGATMNLTPLQLVQSQLVGQGITVSNATFNGSSGVINSDQIGYFSTAGPAIQQLGINDGLLLTSGKASLAIGPNNSPGAGGSTVFSSDPDLNIIANTTTNDKCVLEFDFVPQADTLRFRYVFGSEEFFEYCNSYNDAFGFFLSGPGITGTFSNSSVNIALMPESNNYVTINNLCADPTSNWNNAGGTFFQYDGMSIVFTAWHIVVPCSTYHIKLAIADAADKALDSGVFLEKNSFNATGLLVSNSFSAPKYGNKSVEGCSDATVSFVLQQPTVQPYTVNWTIGGTAIMGVDYDTIPTSIIIPAGGDSAAIVIHPLLDLLAEPVEYVVLGVTVPSCAGPTIFNDTIFILDNTPFSVTVNNDTTVCSGDSITLTAVPSGGKIPYDYGWNTGSTLASIKVAPPVGTTMYVATVLDGCWTTARDTMYVHVDTLPVITNTSFLSEVCSQGSTNIALLSSKAGSTFAWSANSPSPFISGYMNGNGNLIAQPLINTGLTFDTVYYHVHAIHLGCDGPDTIFKVVVKPKPDATFTPTGQNICTGQTTNIAISSNVPGTNFTWTYSSTPFITGASNGSGNLIAQTLTNTGNTIDTVIYHVSPVQNTCLGNIYNVKVVVNPYPVINSTILNDTLCSNTSTNLVLSSTVLGSTFTWTSSLIAGNVSGFSNGSGNSIIQLLINNALTVGKVKYRVIPSANGCIGAPEDFQALVDPIPSMTNTQFQYQICSGQTTNIPLQSNISGTTYSWVATSSSPNLTGYSSSSGAVISQTIQNSGVTVDSVVYQVTPYFNGCNGLPIQIVVKVNPVPDVYSIPVLQNLCSGATSDIALFSHTTGTTFAWTTTPSSLFVTGFSNGSNDTIKQTLVNSGYATESVTYHVSPTVNGCTNLTPLNIVVTVYPVPNLSNSPLSKEICNNQNCNVVLTSNVSGTLFTWSATGSSVALNGYQSNATPSAAISDILNNTGYTQEFATYSITPQANGCSGNSYTYTVHVNPTPDLSNHPLNTSICQSNSTNINLTSNVTGTLFTWSCSPVTGNVLGYSDNSIPTTVINQTLTLSNFVAGSVVYHVLPHLNGCVGSSTDFTVTVNPVPMVTTNPMHDTLCSATLTTIHLTSTCAGTTFDWTAQNPLGVVTGFSNGSGADINQTLVNQTNTIGEVTYHIIPTAGLCAGHDTVYAVYLYPKPHVLNTILSDTICSNSSPGLLLSSDVAGTTFFWTASTSSPTISGFSNGSGTMLNDLLINNGFMIEKVTYKVVPRAHGCNGDTTTFEMFVFPVPDFSSAPATASLCSASTTNFSLLSNVVGATFTWSATGSSPNVSGFSAGSGTSILQTLTNAGTSIETVTYTVTPHAFGCPAGASGTIPVTVFPVAHLTTAPLSQTICNPGGITVPLTSTVAGTTYSWICVASSTNLSGFSNGTGSTINQTLVNSGYTIDTVTYSITPTANGCAGTVSHYKAIVNPTPDLSNTPLSSQVCNNTPTGITLTSHVLNTLFTWSCTPSSANVSGFSPSVVPTTTLNQTLINAGLNVETVTYHVVPHANGCDGNSADFVVTVVSSPDVYFSPTNETICSEQVSNIQLLSHVPGTTFAWSATGSSGQLTGFSAGNGNAIQQTLTNSGTVAETATYIVTPTAWGCPPGIANSVVVTVNPKPHLLNSTTTYSHCSATTTSIVFQSSVAGSTYAWIASGSSGSVSGYSNGSGSGISQTLINSGFTIETVNYLVTPSANGCSGVPTTFTITVYPVADVYFTPASQAICPLQSCSIQVASHVASTTFTWTASGSSANVTGFSGGSGSLIAQTLNNLSYSNEQVTYTVTPLSNGCIGTNNAATVTIHPNPTVTLTSCSTNITTLDAKPFPLKGGIPSGGTYQGRGVVAGTFDPALAGVGTDTIRYSYTNNYGCSKNSHVTIVVTAPLPFTCGSPLLDIRDNQSYPTVQQGTQCWMAANLNYGSEIPFSQNQNDNCVSEKHLYPPSLSAGAFYQWDELMDYQTAAGVQGLCPPGWHIPTENEWTTLFNQYISDGFAGSPLKSTGFSGFSAFLGGANLKNVAWYFNGFATFLWSSNAHGPYKAWAHGMNDYNPSVSKYPSSRSNAFPVRCLKD